MSARLEFLAAPLADAVPVELPGGFTVHVRPLPYGLLCGLREKEKAGGLPDEYLPIAVAHAVCDDAGRPLFDPECDADLEALAGKPLPALRLILDAALEASAVDVAAAKKNSPATASPSGS